MFNKIRLFYNTIRYLNGIQIFGRIYSDIKKNIYSYGYIKINIPHITKTNITPKTNFIFHDPWNERTKILKNDFTFIGLKFKFKDKINWTLTSMPLLWQFNLHYLNYLFLLNKDEQIEFLARLD